jgi:hypothetical protein
MSFGTKRHLEEFETIHIASAHENDVKYCGCTFQIHWSLSNISSSEGTSIFKVNHHPTSVELLLPLTHPPLKSKQKKQSYVTSTRIASILYLTKGTEFHIIPLHSCHSSSSLAQDPEYDPCCGPFQFTLQLYMDQNVETRVHKQAQHMYKTNTTTAIQDNHEQHDAPIHQSILNHKYIDLHPIEYKKKPWVCVECKRCFDSPKATRNHCISKHAIPSLVGSGMNCRHSGEDYSDLIGPEIFHIPLQAVYQDDDIAIIVKPQGIPVQGGRWTLNNTDLLLPFCAPKG